MDAGTPFSDAGPRHPRITDGSGFALSARGASDRHCLGSREPRRSKGVWEHWLRRCVESSSPADDRADGLWGFLGQVRQTERTITDLAILPDC